MLLFSVFKVSGHSMMPTLKPGSVVIVSKIPYLFSKPKNGDIIVFVNKASQKKMIKRIKKIDREKYYMIGDNANDSLEIGWINKKDIVGKAIYTINF